MRLTKILLPTDFSLHSYEGLRAAETLAQQSGAQLLIVHVVDPDEDGDHEGQSGSDKARDNLEKRLFETMPARPNLTVSHALLEGDVAAEIVQFALREGVDLIVMGSHGRTGIPRALMGSVATQVLRHAPCPVLTIRPKVQLRGDIMAWAHRKPQPRQPSPSSST
jgi:nucleotide-binding universal stress UspA family protein